MAIADDLSYIFHSEIAGKLGFLINLFQAVGFFIIAYVIINLINIFFNRKRTRQIEKINEKLEEIKGILSKISSKK